MSSKMYTNSDEQIAALRSASTGFDHLFANRMDDAKASFQDKEHSDSPFHLMGLGVCSFLEAALGMEVRNLAPIHACFLGVVNNISCSFASLSKWRSPLVA